MQTPDELESDWIHAVFDVLREEVISIAADFGDRVKRQIDQVAATTDLRPPSAAALLGAVAIETTNMATSLLPGAATPGADHDDGDDDDDKEREP
ncbi:MAG: hypothetical protein R3B09_00125 [Nannocystaceae bacterium]